MTITFARPTLVPPFALLTAPCLVLSVLVAACGGSAPTDDNAGQATAEPTGSGGDVVASGPAETSGPPEQAPIEPRPPSDPFTAPANVAAPPPEAERTPTGLATLVLEAGKGDRHPTATDQVTVHYSGWTTDGQLFDSSHSRGNPATFPLNRVIAGWTEGVQLMVEGEKRRLWIPEELAYGGAAGKPKGMLVFDVELLTIVD